MFCRKCGGSIESGAQACTTCGAATVETSEPTVVQHTVSGSAGFGRRAFEGLLNSMAGGAVSVEKRSVTRHRIVIQNESGTMQEYDSVADMPPDVRAKYDEAMSKIAGVIQAKGSSDAIDAEMSSLVSASIGSAKKPGSPNWAEAKPGSASWKETGSSSGFPMKGRPRNSSFLAGLISMLIFFAIVAVFMKGSALISWMGL